MANGNDVGLDGLLTKIKSAINELTSLKIITAVGHVAYKSPDSNDSVPSNLSDAELPVTVINSKRFVKNTMI